MIVQLKLPHAGTWEVSQKQICPPRSLLTKRQRADTLKLEYLKMLGVSHIDSIWRLCVDAIKLRR